MPRASARAWALRRAATVLTATIREQLPGRSGGDEVPASPRDVSAEWLTAKLCASVPGARVTGVTRLGASAGTTTRASLELSLNDPGSAMGLPTRVFIKCTATAAQRLMLGLGGLIGGEPGFYNHVRPGLEIEAPDGYFAAVDPRTWRSIVVMEDVAATRGARFWTPDVAISRGQAEQLVDEMAIWHGSLWNDERLSAWTWLRTPAEQMQIIDALIGVADRTSAGTARARAVIPAALRGRKADLYEGMRRSLTLASREPPTYLHGDLHIANTYLTRAGRVGVADWQVALKGSWVHDYAYLVTTAFEVENRRAWERRLLQVYLDRLARTGGPTISESDAWEAYRRAPLYPYFAWVYTIGRSRLQPRFQPDAVCLTMIERIAMAIDDLDSLRALGL